MMPKSFRVAPTSPIACISLLLLASCGSTDTVEQKNAPAGQDPPGVAKALSLGTEASSEVSDWEINVNCAAALQVTALALNTMAGESTSEALRGVRDASKRFQSLAEQTDKGASAKAAIASRVSENVDDKSGQARLAIGCIRRLEAGAGRASSEG